MVQSYKLKEQENKVSIREKDSTINRLEDAVKKVEI